MPPDARPSDGRGRDGHSVGPCLTHPGGISPPACPPASHLPIDRIQSPARASRAAAPEVELEVTVATQGEILRTLEEAEVDVIVSNLGEAVPDGCVRAPLYQERYLVLLPPGHRLKGREDPSAA
ncbi:MAG: LysR family transcriptional regulator substrate-binding protein [Polyangiaceae bacterium]